MQLWIKLAQYVIEALALVLIFRLLLLRDKDNGVYRFLLFFLVCS